jgi:hypothetical protein
MSPSRALLTSALWVACSVGSFLVAPSATAQIYDAARGSIDLAGDPLRRSPRLLGMGRLTLADDRHNRITLWDFAADPAGILDADSTSTLLLWPATASQSGVHDRVDGPGQREALAAREVRTDYELWRRTENNAYGFSGDLANLRLDRPFDDDTEQRGRFWGPRVVGVLNGRMPHFRPERTRFAIHVRYVSEIDEESYRSLYRNGSGEYIGKSPGTEEDPPDFFAPEEVRGSTVGAGAGISYRFGYLSVPEATEWAGLTTLVASIGGDISSSRLETENSSALHFAGTGEDRPYYTGHASLIGALGSHFEWGATGRVWTSSTQDDWVFTIQTGIAQTRSGRGLLLTRDEDGREGRARVRWVGGPLELGASSRVAFQAVTSTPPDTNDQSSLNSFLNFVVNRFGVSSGLPDSVVGNHSEDRYWDFALGGSWRLPRNRGIVGVEFHKIQDRLQRELLGTFRLRGTVVEPDGTERSVIEPDWRERVEGPFRKVWDVRGGLEFACTKVLKARLGYIYRSDDRDESTLQNEYLSHTVTGGLGLTPQGSVWSVEAGYAIEWLQPDFVDPLVSRESRQMLALQVGWWF